MKKIYFYQFLLAIFILIIASCKNQNRHTDNTELSVIIETNKSINSITSIKISFFKGTEHNYPLMAIWAEDTNGKYLETFFVAQSVAKGIFEHGKGDKGKWQPGAVRRPATLPYWAHKRNVKEKDELFIPTPETPMPDAISGPTPKSNFELITKNSNNYMHRVFNIMFEINQSWDWNEFWTNDKFPDDKEYATSSQPSIVYQTQISLDSLGKTYLMKPIGHGHYSGKSGELFNDLSTITTALKIADRIIVKIEK